MEAYQLMKNNFIYLISTNRPEWGEFAFAQYLKCPGKLVVLDNSKDGVDFWKSEIPKGAIDYKYYHLPHCSNEGEMYNWFVKEYQDSKLDLFYMDDDVEISSEINEIFNWTLPERGGWDCVWLNSVYITDAKTNVSFLYNREDARVGSVWYCKNDLWKKTTFSPTVGGCHAWRKEVLRWGNVKRIRDPLANFLIHDTNQELRSSKDWSTHSNCKIMPLKVSLN
jgi:hypothetical protein